ncbi:MAG TPA: ISAs1 family transposase, partial [Candidatus Megaira endosymbiont of Nemacystus decipiens]|nr:ISAs1 family transposase [Candidatus Megaera endosymbiont of Nemacystus decipiens]
MTETLKKLDPNEIESVFAEIVSLNNDKIKQIAIDGKSICSTSKSDKGLLHLLSAYSPEIKGVIRQTKSDLAGGEIKAATKIIPDINIKNKVITGDALFSQEELCSTIVKNQGHYLFKVKRNKKRIIQDIEQIFNLHNNKKIPITKFESIKKAHGRIDHRIIEVIETTAKYFGGWGTDIVDYIEIERFSSLSLAIYLSSYFPQMEQHCRRNKTITKSQNIFYKI